MDGPLNLLAPYEQSAAFDVTEKQLQQLFIDVFNEVFADQVSDIHHYGMPHLGSPKVVERFTKQDGLVVLRRPTSSDLIMRIIYTDWKSLASRRGLAFLEFVLQMLLGNQWKIYRLYHSSLRAEKYPDLVTIMKTADSFLTSRIMIDLSQDVDFSEILELSPVLFRLVPANIVPSLSSNVEFNDLNNLNTAIGFIPYMSAYFQDMSGYSVQVDNIVWTNWQLSNVIVISRNGSATYRAFKSNGLEVVKSYAVYDLRPLVEQVLINTSYQGFNAVRSAIESLLDSTFNSYKFNADASAVEVSLNIPETDLDYSAVLDVILARMAAGYDFAEMSDVAAIFESFGWYIKDWTIQGDVIAPISQRAEYKYSTNSVVDYSGYYGAAKKHVEQLKTTTAWADRELGNLYLEYESEDQAHYIQEYSEGGVQDAILIVVDKSINPDFMGVNAVVSEPISRQAILEAFTYAAGTPQSKEHVKNVVKAAYSYGEPIATNTLFNSLKTQFTRAQVATAIIRNLNSADAVHASNSIEFMQAIANTTIIVNPAFQLVKFTDLVPQFNENAERVAVPNASYAPLTNVSLQVIEYV